MAYTRDDEERILIAWATNAQCHSAWRLRLTDFSSPASRFIFDVVKKFSEQHGMLPGAEAVSKEVELALRGDSQFTYTTKPDNMVLPAVADLLGRLAEGFPEDEITRIGSTVTPFLDMVRVSQVARLAQENGWSPGKTVEAMNEAHEDVKSVTGIDPSDVFSSGCEVDFSDMESPTPRVGSGIEWLDTNMGGGLERGNVALLIAVSGLGKTVGMINFAANANVAGLHTLFMTLENPKVMIQRRWQAIMGHYSARLYRQPLSTWPEDCRKRFKLLTSKDCVFWDKFSILDKSGKKPMTIDEIEKAIIAWKRQNMARGIPEERLAVVCIDWLKYIDMSSVPGVTRNSRADEPIALAIQALGNIAKRNKVVIWTAQQVNRGGQKKEVLGPEDIADATSVQNYLDLGIGFARQSGDLQAQAASMDGSSGGQGQQDTDRTLILSCFKAREAAIAGSRTSIYQSGSLRLWASKEQAMRMMTRIRGEDPTDHYMRGGAL